MPTKMLAKGLTAPKSATPRRAVKLAPEGIVTAIVAVTGVVDAVGDLIVPGAFAHTLTVRRPKVVDDHEWKRKVGRVLHAEEWLPGDERLPKRTKDGKPWPAAAGALVATMQYNLNTPRGAESYEWVRFYAETNEAEFSIGYKVPDGKARKRRDEVRVILMVDLFEFSHVLFGAAPLSMALDVKSLDGATGKSDEDPDEDETADYGDTDPSAAPDARQPWDDDDDDTGTKASMESKTAASVLLEAKTLNRLTAMEGKSADNQEVKAMGRMKGSYEERISMIEQAVRDQFDTADTGDVYVCPVATYASEVVVTVHRGGEPPESYLIPYSTDEEGAAVETGEPVKVELSLVAEPERGEDGEPTEVPFDATAYAPAVEVKTAETPDDEDEDLPGEVEADEDTITKDNLPDGDWRSFRKTEPIRAVHLDEPFTVQTREGIVESDGGWLALDSDDYPYPIADDEFENVYEPADDEEPEVEAEVDAPAEDLEDEVETKTVDGDDDEKVTLSPDAHYAVMDELDGDDD